MTDVFSKSKRSEIMSKIRSRDTKLDKRMETLLKENCFDYVKYPKIFGNPDFIVKPNVVVFCDSGFWHGRNWRKLRKRLGKISNSNYWIKHISKNRSRDRLVTRTLKKEGHVVLRFWDDQVFKNPNFCVREIEKVGGVRKIETNETGRANFWIEVTSGMRWERLLREGVRLEAPNTTRYRHFFEGVKSGDFVLHYLTTALTMRKEKQSSVVGISRVTSNPTVVGKKIVAGCSNTLEFLKSVSYGELLELKRKSPSLERLVGFSMQRYLTQISRSDFEFILNAHLPNMRRFLRSPLARMLRKVI